MIKDIFDILKDKGYEERFVAQLKEQDEYSPEDAFQDKYRRILIEILNGMSKDALYDIFEWFMGVSVREYAVSLLEEEVRDLTLEQAKDLYDDIKLNYGSEEWFLELED